MKRLRSFLSSFVADSLFRAGYTLVPIGSYKLAKRTRENFAALCGACEAWLPQDVALPENPNRANLLARQHGTPPAEAFHLIYGLAKTAALDGDICEFGVAQGEISALLASEIVPGKKRLHLFDSFEGLPEPTSGDELKDDVLGLGSIGAYAGHMANPESLVLARLDDLGFPKERYVIHKGFFGDLLPKKLNFPTKVSFAYVDFDFYEPIKQALEFVDGISPAGAIFIVDDYDFFSTGAKKAVDEFLAPRQKFYRLTVPDPRIGHFAILEKLDA